MATADDFDVYYMWLGISPEERPAHYYRLLDVKAFESNVAAIDMGYHRRMAYLKSIKDGVRLDEAERLKNELTEAQRCLLNPEKKVAYDAALKLRLSPSASPPARVPEPPPLPAAWTTTTATSQTDAAEPVDSVPHPRPKPATEVWRPFDETPLHDELPPLGSTKSGEDREQTFRAADPSRDWATETSGAKGAAVAVKRSAPFAFAGRASRLEYWTTVAFASIVLAIGQLIGNFVYEDWLVVFQFAVGAVYVAIMVFAVWLLLAVQVKRWHDVNLSGWWTFVVLIPWFGLIITIALGFTPGSAGRNDYGDPPLDQFS